MCYALCQAIKEGVIEEVEEEIALLEEQLASAHADIQRLQDQLADVTAKVRTQESEGEGLKRRLAEAQQTLAEREEALAAGAGEIEALRTALAEADGQARTAAGRYRELLLASEPSLPSDLVEGDSIAAIDEAAARARQTVARVRQHLEEQAQAQRVPAGSPPRGAPDLSDLSPAEKIRLGLEER